MRASKAGRLHHERHKSAQRSPAAADSSKPESKIGAASEQDSFAANITSHASATDSHTVLDPARFAREQGRSTGVFQAKQLARLAEVAIDEHGKVEYGVRGYLNEKGQPALHLAASVDVAVPCQRCLEPLPLRFDVQRHLVFVDAIREFDPIHDEDEAVDTVPLTKSLELRDLIDQEVLLSLPMAACHPQGECSPRSEVATESAKASPFAVLAQLKKQ
jgi:uncharacterized protein